MVTAASAAATVRSIWSLKMAPGVTLKLSAFLVLIAAIIPVYTKLEQTGIRQAFKEASASDEEMLNDALIISAPNVDCPDVDDVGCLEVQSRGNDALIYPTSVHSTAKPSFSTRRHAEPPYYTQTAPTRPQQSREPPCPDDEDCPDNSGDDSASVRAGNSQPEDAYFNRRSTEMISGLRPSVEDHQRPSYVEIETPNEPADLESNQTHEVNLLPGDKEITNESEVGGYGSTPPTDGSTGAGRRPFGSLKDHYQLAINMNIILIVGIAVGIVVLLLILIVAVCKYKGQGSKSPPMGKTDRAKSYTYEACNTGPPVSVPPGDPDAIKSRSSTSIAFGLPTTPATAVTTTITTTTTPAAPHSKPARKGVKEWYV